MFEQGVIKVEKEREFGDLKAAMEQAFAADAIDLATGDKAGTARSLYGSLPISDQAQVREFYLSKIEEVDPALRAKFHKLYQYY